MISLDIPFASLAQITPPGGPWPGPMTFVGLGLLVLALVIYFMSRGTPRDEPEEKD